MPLEIIRKNKIKKDDIVDTTAYFNIDDKNKDSKQKIIDCYKYILQQAISQNQKSITLNIISTNDLDIPKTDIFSIIINTIRNFLYENDLEVSLVINDKKELNLSKKHEIEIEKYLKKHDFSLTKKSSKRPSIEKTTFVLPNQLQETELFECCEETINIVKKKEIDLLNNYKEDESFNECLKRLIYEKGLIEKDVYCDANLTKQAFNGIYNEKKTPKKGNALALAIGLKLNIEETQDFIEKAGYSFGRTKQDYIVRYFIENKIYDIFEINCFLMKYDLPYLGSSYK